MKPFRTSNRSVRVHEAISGQGSHADGSPGGPPPPCPVLDRGPAPRRVRWSGRARTPMPDALSRISQERRDGGKMTCWRLVDSVRPCAGAGRCNVCPTLAQRAQNSRFHAWTDVPYLLASSHTAILDRAAILIPEARNCMLCCDVVDQAYCAVSEKRSSKSAEIKSPSNYCDLG